MARQEGSEFAWFLAGMALGLAGALLVAPQSGEETRRALRDRAERGRERFRDAGQVAAERSRDWINEAAESGRKVYERGRDLYGKGRDLAEETATDLAEAPPPQALGDPSEES